MDLPPLRRSFPRVIIVITLLVFGALLALSMAGAFHATVISPA